jgi:hypothetical protein
VLDWRSGKAARRGARAWQREGDRAWREACAIVGARSR